MRKGARQQVLADAFALLTRRDEELRQEPQVAARPAKGKAAHVTVFFRDPQAVGIVAERELGKGWRTHAGDRTETMTLREVVDAGDDERAGTLQIAGAGGSVDDRHVAPPCYSETAG